MFYKFFFIVPFIGQLGKILQNWADNRWHLWCRCTACWKPKVAHIHSEYVILWFSTATVVT